jgi:hypothetical protein
MQLIRFIAASLKGVRAKKIGYTVAVKCQDIDDPSLTVKSARTSMTLMKKHWF